MKQTKKNKNPKAGIVLPHSVHLEVLHVNTSFTSKPLTPQSLLLPSLPQLCSTALSGPLPKAESRTVHSSNATNVGEQGS